jgi:hypothetical protein
LHLDSVQVEIAFMPKLRPLHFSDVTFTKLDQQLAVVFAHNATFAGQLQRFINALVVTKAFTNAQRQTTAELLSEVLRDQLKEPAKRRTPGAIAYLVNGVRRIVAHVGELACLWSEIEPQLTVR